IGPDGSFYIVENQFGIRRVDPAGIITTVAGDFSFLFPAFSGDGGPATQAHFSPPEDVKGAPGGSLFITVWGNERIRQVDAAGIINTVAGNGTRTYDGDNSLALGTGIDLPEVVDSVVLRPDGSFLILDSGGKAIRRVGQAMPGLALSDHVIP